MIKKLIAIILFWVFIPLSAFAGTQATSGVTVQDIIDRAGRDLSVTISTTTFWTTNDLIQWTDEAVREIAYRTRCLESGSSNIAVQSQTWSYAISGSYLDIDTVFHDSGDTTSPTQIFTLERVDVKEIGHSKEKGRPKFYTVWNDNLLIWPIPDSTQSGTTLYAYKIDLPSGVSGVTNAIETPSYFDAAILYYVKGRAYQKERKEASSIFYLQRFEAYLDEYLKKLIKRVP